MSKTERMAERVTVKMDANLKAKLQREAERCGGDMSAYIRSLIENRLSQAAGTCLTLVPHPWSGTARGRSD
ncbi:MAG: CopG family transcriptional regulator [Clostridia bacterium]|nr:CopG family transcriptional regulator [Clostridia bacterium]